VTGLGSLPNKSSSTPFKVKITVAAIATVFANSATVGGSCRFRMTPESYWSPTATTDPATRSRTSRRA
jgi:hypothetical protein